MSKAYISLADDVLQNDAFLDDYRTLFGAYVLDLVGDEYEEPSVEVARRLSRSAQIFIASGSPEKIDVGIRIVDMFLEIAPSYINDIILIAETLFTKLGDFPNISLIESKWENRPILSKGFDQLLQEALHRDINRIESLDIEATNFQINLWNNLTDGRDLVTIAPTSAGKSFIIIRYLIQQVTEAEDETTFAVYIVPSRALIYEISRTIQATLAEKGIDDVEIVTMGQKDRDYTKKTIFVLTQERLLVLLNYQKLMRFTYVVIDEAQNISENNRGVLLHIVLSQIVTRGQSQLIFCSPSDSYRSTFDSFMGEDARSPITNHSPVSKNFMRVKCQRRSIFVSSENPTVEIEIPKKFTGTHQYSIIAQRLGFTSSNIVYANTKADCVRVAKKLAEEATAVKDELKDASDYIRYTVHEDYSLADAILKGIVFHYGPLPRNVRILIESYVKDGLIDYIVCTSTLAEGVNLPAKNLFISDPKLSRRGESNECIPKVQYKNIIGRAGRLMTHFSGNVILVDPDSWEFQEVLEAEDKEEKLPSYFKLLMERPDDVIRTLRGLRISEDLDVHTLNATANKILQDEANGRLNEIVASYVPQSSRLDFITAISDLHNSIDIPPAIFNLNPSFGIIQQNRLYNHLLEMDFFEDYSPVYPYRLNPFKRYLLKLIPMLRRFDLLYLGEGSWVESYEYVLSLVGAKWASGVSMKEIIADAISADRRKGKNSSIDSIVTKTVARVNDDIRFKLASAIKCFSDLYQVVAIEREIENMEDIPEIHSFLEIGACEPLTVNLISQGLSRQTAIDVRGLMPDLDEGASNLIHLVKADGRYGRLHKMTQREIDGLAG